MGYRPKKLDDSGPVRRVGDVGGERPLKGDDQPAIKRTEALATQPERQGPS